jgi:hypothetical protein
MNIIEQGYRDYLEREKGYFLEYKINTVLNGSRDGLTMETTKNGKEVWSCNDKRLISFKIVKKEERFILIVKS